jgi:mono/diheme cytochrome c family protein
MEYPGGSFDLRTFPSGQFARFEAAVTKGKNNMPPWGEVLQPGELEALWAYVMAGEKKK